jgi:3-deoxy-manno-octulosonate cytidylyltransferase (CMP-KDO synthetase)
MQQAAGIFNLHFKSESVNYIMQKAVVIIPARFHSTRFPGKPLAPLHGKPLIQHVYEQAVKAKLVDSVFVATDDRKIFDVVNGFGGRAVETSPDHTSGTDRVAEAAMQIESDIVVNVQGDEPFIKPEMIDDVISLLLKDERASISTLARKTADVGEILSPNVVKVVVDNEWFALYFSRSPIPFYRDEWKRREDMSSASKRVEVLKHIGIYGFRKDSLIQFSSLSRSRLEVIEKLEQLRALASGIKIKVKETVYDTLGIDTAEDLRKADEWLSLSL